MNLLTYNFDFLLSIGGKFNEVIFTSNLADSSDNANDIGNSTRAVTFAANYFYDVPATLRELKSCNGLRNHCSSLFNKHGLDGADFMGG